MPAVRAICRSSAGATSCAAIARARSAQLPGNVFRPPLDGLDERPAFAGVLRRQAHLPQRLVDQEGRRHEPRCARGLHPAKLAVELLGIGLQPREIGLGVGGVLDAMVAVEEARDVEIGADVLDDDVGRVAPAANRDVAVREREALRAPSHRHFERPRNWCVWHAKARRC